MEAPSPTPPAPFSTVIRTASHEQHTEAENSSFMSDLLGGKLGVHAYRRYTEQLWFVYRALEDGSDALADDPVAGPFIRPELARTAAAGARPRPPAAGRPGARAWSRCPPPPRMPSGCRTAPATGRRAMSPTTTPATSATSPAARSSAARPRRPGASRARATGCGSTSSRTSPTRPPSSGTTASCWTPCRVDDLEKQRVVDECKRAFALNGAVFRELGEEFPLSA